MNLDQLLADLDGLLKTEVSKPKQTIHTGRKQKAKRPERTKHPKHCKFAEPEIENHYVKNERLWNKYQKMKREPLVPRSVIEPIEEAE